MTKGQTRDLQRPFPTYLFSVSLCFQEQLNGKQRLSYPVYLCAGFSLKHIQWHLTLLCIFMTYLLSLRSFTCGLFFFFFSNLLLLHGRCRDEVILHSSSMYSSQSFIFGGISFAQICFSQHMIHISSKSCF